MRDEWNLWLTAHELYESESSGPYKTGTVILKGPGLFVLRTNHVECNCYQGYLDDTCLCDVQIISSGKFNLKSHFRNVHFIFKNSFQSQATLKNESYLPLISAQSDQIW